jgi:hypothetical protein
MNRRELLKFSLFSPLLGLFKSRKSGASTGLTTEMLLESKAGLQLPETTGTSSEGPVSIFYCSCGTKLPDESEDYYFYCGCGRTYSQIKWQGQ